MIDSGDEPVPQPDFSLQWTIAFLNLEIFSFSNKTGGGEFTNKPENIQKPEKDW